MPSGAKKRKAAKKKKEQEAHQINDSNNNNKLSHGNHEPGSHDEKKSDNVVTSTLCIDHDNKAPAKEVIRYTEATQKVGLEDEVAVETQKEPKSHENIVKKPTDPLQENAIQATENAPVQEARVNSLLQQFPFDDSVKHAVSEPKEAMHVESKPNETSIASDVEIAAAVAETGKDAEIAESETPAPSENELLVAPASPFVRKTSWLSCCGLLDVITGTRR